MDKLSWLPLSLSLPQKSSATSISFSTHLLVLLCSLNCSLLYLHTDPPIATSNPKHTQIEESLDFYSRPDLIEITQMDWYLREDCDGLIVPDHREAEAAYIEDLLPTEDDWCNWGITESNHMASHNKHCAPSIIPSMEKSNLNRQMPSCQVSKAAPDSQPDFELENNMERTDDIFVNSFLEADQLCPDSPYSSLPFEDMLSNMLADPPNLLEPPRGDGATCMNACNFPMFVDDSPKDWYKGDDSLSCLTSDRSKRFKGSPTDHNPSVLVPPVTSATDVTRAVAEPNCSEAIVLLELEDVMLKLNENTRICFRDALYRLARCSKQNHSMNRNRSTVATDGLFSAQVNCENSRMGSSRSTESSMNVIDRTIANLMFSEQRC